MFRVLSKNINTMSSREDYLQWKAIAQALITSESNAIALQETSTAWTKLQLIKYNNYSNSQAVMPR